MQIKKTIGFFLGGMLLTMAAQTLVIGQETPKKELKKVSMPYSDPTSGAQMYKDYCAACHGPEGKGNGAAVEFLKAPPPDLTTLAQRNGGKYPAEKLVVTLKLGPGTRAHGTIDMPIWGQLFNEGSANRNVAELRIHNLIEYVRGLQR